MWRPLSKSSGGHTYRSFRRKKRKMKNKAAVALYHFLITAMVVAFVALTIFAGTPHGLTYDDRQRIGGGDAGEADGASEYVGGRIYPPETGGVT